MFLNCNLDPACQSISTQLQCYLRERYCTDQSNTEESSGQNIVTLIMSIGSAVFITSCIIMILCYKRRQANRNKSKLNNKHDLFHL